jgi:hypothetical protein
MIYGYASAKSYAYGCFRAMIDAGETASPLSQTPAVVKQQITVILNT